MRPGGTLISSDGAEAMIEVARARAAQLGIDNVEFRQLELEWIDLETASVDAVLVPLGDHADRRPARPPPARSAASCGQADTPRWRCGTRGSAIRGRLIPSMALLELGHAEPPDPDAPGPFALAEEGRLAELLEDAGFTEVEVIPVDLERHYASAQDIVAESANCSPSFGAKYHELSEEQQAEVAAHMTAAAAPYAAPDGSVTLPGISLVARAGA